MNTESAKRELLRLGLMYDKFSGIQIDINGAFRGVPPENPTGTIEASYCDHNCVDPYECPAAKMLNRGIAHKTMAPAVWLIQKVEHGVAGLRARRDQDLAGLDEHCAKFQIPAKVQEAIRQILSEGNVEINLFGGNPELHPEIIELVGAMKDLGHQVNLTTTGRRLMRDEAFAKAFLDCPPHLLALSAGETEIDDLRELLELNPDQLKTRWRKIDPKDGPRQKMVESVYVARWSQGISEFPTLLFNMVLSGSNLCVAQEMITLLEQAFPRAIVNPYLNQEGFHFGSAFLFEEDLERFEQLVEWAIERTLAGGRFVKRLHVWLLFEAIRLTWPNDPKQRARSMAGYGIWKCYKPGSGRYLQIGRSPLFYRQVPVSHPGGHLGCFWNDTTVTERPQIESPDQVARYLGKGMQTLSQEAERPCPGCAMPRLMFDLPNLQAGMDERLWPAFLDRRRKYAGF